MDRWFDEAARSAANPVSRRQALRRIAAGLGAAVFAVVGAGPAFAARRECPPGHSVPCDGLCCPKDTFCCSAGGGKVVCCPKERFANICPTVEDLLALCVAAVPR